MSDNRSEHPGFTLAALALIATASACFYLYVEGSADLTGDGTVVTQEIPRPLYQVDQLEIPQARDAKQQTRWPSPDLTKNPQTPLDYGGNWGIVSADMVESGMVSAKEAIVLNEATIRFAGSAAQASNARIRE